MAAFWVVALTVVLKMEAVQTSETLVDSHQSARSYNPEGRHLHSHSRGNFKFYKQK
jgi:hypothetical protein